MHFILPLANTCNAFVYTARRFLNNYLAKKQTLILDGIYVRFILSLYLNTCGNLNNNKICLRHLILIFKMGLLLSLNAVNLDFDNIVSLYSKIYRPCHLVFGNYCAPCQT